MYRKLIFAGARRFANSPVNRKYAAAAFGAVAVGIITPNCVNTESKQVAYCDSAQIKLPDVQPTKIVAIASKQEGFLSALVAAVSKAASRAGEVAEKLYRYTSRIFTYSLYGTPLLAMLPFYFTLGRIFPAVEEMMLEYLIWSTQRLGPCFIKLAQWASSRPDLFPPKLVNKLIRLQDDVPTYYPISAVHKTMEGAFGANWRDLIVLDKKPIGAGCVAQVRCDAHF